MGNYISEDKIASYYGESDQQRQRMVRFVNNYLRPDIRPIWSQEYVKEEDLATMDESIRAGTIANIIRYNNSHIRINEAYVHERDYFDVRSDKVIYPGNELEFARRVMADNIELSPLEEKV